MRELEIANVALRLEAAAAGGRYRAPILILPGLFQSWTCWRGMTSMLAHRGWNVYLLPRIDGHGPEGAATGPERWSAALEAAVTVVRSLDERPIVFGADVGASLALQLPDQVRPLALGLFAPASPEHVGRAYESSLGFFARRRARSGGASVSAPAPIAKTVHRPTDAAAEPRGFVADLVDVAFTPPANHPPAIVFAPEADPLVERQHSLGLLRTDYAKPARTPVVGRWWPSSRWEPVTDEVHRFVILTLADRVVEFPEEILED